MSVNVTVVTREPLIYVNGVYFMHYPCTLPDVVTIGAGMELVIVFEVTILSGIEVCASPAFGPIVTLHVDCMPGGLGGCASCNCREIK